MTISSAYFGERERRRLIFRILIWNSTLALHNQLEQVLREIVALRKSLQLQNSTVKYNYFFTGRRPRRRRRHCLRSLTPLYRENEPELCPFVGFSSNIICGTTRTPKTIDTDLCM